MSAVVAITEHLLFGVLVGVLLVGLEQWLSRRYIIKRLAYDQHRIAVLDAASQEAHFLRRRVQTDNVLRSRRLVPPMTRRPGAFWTIMVGFAIWSIVYQPQDQFDTMSATVSGGALLVFATFDLWIRWHRSLGPAVST